MEINYKLDEIRLIAGGDDSFIAIIVAAFLEEVPEALRLIMEGYGAKNHNDVYQNSHKIKPTIKQFHLSVYDELMTLHDWGKNKEDADVSGSLAILKLEIDKVVEEMKSDFNL